MSVPQPAGRPFWFKALLTLAVLIIVCNIGAYLYGLTLPNEWRADESIVIDAPPEAVYPLVASPKRWTEWSSWSRRQDPTLELAYDGPESGAGASFAWRGEQLGLGKLKILGVEPNRSVRYELTLRNQPFSKQGKIALEPVADGTRVTWSDGGELDSTLGRLFRERLENSVAAEFRASLARLKKLVEASATGGS